MKTRSQAIEELGEIKTLLVQSHRNQDWDKAKKLSQKRTWLRRVIARKKVCIDCGEPISQNAINRCRVHDILIRRGNAIA